MCASAAGIECLVHESNMGTCILHVVPQQLSPTCSQACKAYASACKYIALLVNQPYSCMRATAGAGDGMAYLQSPSQRQSHSPCQHLRYTYKGCGCQIDMFVDQTANG